MSAKPYRDVHLFRASTTAIKHKLLKCFVSVFVCDNRQCGISICTKLSRSTPTCHRTIRVVTIFLTVDWGAFGKCRYDIDGVKHNQRISYKTRPFIVTNFILSFMILCRLIALTIYWSALPALESANSTTPWVKKRRHYTLIHIFAKYWPIFIIFSPTYSVGNLQ